MPRAIPASNDLAMHEALLAEHKQFRNLHVSYWPPGCYWRMLTAFLPLDFGSMVRQVGHGPEQIVFVESAALFPDLYQQATGIDSRALVGQRVVSINGVPTLDYLRDYIEQVKSHEDPGGGLNGVLGSSEYSLRFAAQRAFVPNRPSDTFVFEAIGGVRQTIELPWVFGLTSLFLGARGYPPTANSEEFRTLCQGGPPPLDGFLSAQGLAQPLFGAPTLSVDGPEEQVLSELRQRRLAPPASSSYFEVSAEQLGQDIEEIIPAASRARVVQYRGDVTAIQLGNTGAWTDVARRGVEYACEHSSRLIIDVRNNSGGNDTVIRWLHHYLFPEDGALTAAGMLALSVRNDNPVFNELLLNDALFAGRFLPELAPSAPACALLYSPGCFVDTQTDTPLGLDQVDWFLSPSRIERRGGQLVSLSRQFALPDAAGDTVFDSASCAGQFAGDDLVLVTNGSNASGGYFLPAAFKGDGVIVNTGGFIGEPMAMGRARGGATQPGSQWSATAREIELATEGQITYQQPILSFERPVDSMMEMLGAYRKDGTTLHIEAPVEADLHVDVWTTLAGSEGFVYERVLRAVDDRPNAAEQ